VTAERVSGPTFIPRETDEKPSDAMPSPGMADWREEAEWWQRTCNYWRRRALGEAEPAVVSPADTTEGTA
jgi:hypothetical protein